VPLPVRTVDINTRSYLSTLAIGDIHNRIDAADEAPTPQEPYERLDGPDRPGRVGVDLIVRIHPLLEKRGANLGRLPPPQGLLPVAVSMKLHVEVCFEPVGKGDCVVASQPSLYPIPPMSEYGTPIPKRPQKTGLNGSTPCLDVSRIKF
jgi:hypothetical protein